MQALFPYHASAPSLKAHANALVVQCGGPTAVINTSLAAVIKAWRNAGKGTLYGARHGLQGVARADWVALDGLTDDDLAALAQQPGAALGSGRTLLREEDLPSALEALDRARIETLFLIGGNGTMAAAAHLADAAQGRLQVLGIPKTIDNDVAGTEVAPGYLSAARFAVQSIHGAGLDLRSMSTFDDVAVVEVMGRHSGWLTAAAGIAALDAVAPPHLLILPEFAIDEDRLMERIAAIHARLGICMVAVSEGAHDSSGVYLAEKVGQGGRDATGQRLLSLSGGAAAYLAAEVRRRLSLRCRQTRPDTLYRSSKPLADALDRDLARRAGEHAVALARGGETLVMAGLRRKQGLWQSVTVPFTQVVGKENPLPPQMFDAETMQITNAFRAWAEGMIETPRRAVGWV